MYLILVYFRQSQADASKLFRKASAKTLLRGKTTAGQDCSKRHRDRDVTNDLHFVAMTTEDRR